MTSYVGSAFAIAAAFLAWDYLAPRLQLQRVRRAIRLRARRDSGRNPP